MPSSLSSQVLESDPNSSERSGLRKEVETELSAASKKIFVLLRQLDEIKDHPDLSRALRKKIPLSLLNIGSSSMSNYSGLLPSWQAPPPMLSSRRLPSSSSHVPTFASIGNSINLRNSPGPADEDFQTTMVAARASLDRLEELTREGGDDKKRERAVQEEGAKLVEALRRSVRVRYELGGKEETMSV